MSKRICVVWPLSPSDKIYWSQLGTVLSEETFRKDPESFDLLCFAGGADVSPSLYGHKNLDSATSPQRDAHEREFVELALKYGIPMAGICRGAQLVNALLGGTLVQDIGASHGGSPHSCITQSGEEFMVNSLHHQMCVPGPGGIVEAWSGQSVPINRMSYDGDLKPLLLEHGLVEEGHENHAEGGLAHVVEAISYPKYRFFAAQWHSEWLNRGPGAKSARAAEWQLQKTREICWAEKGKTICAGSE